MKRLIWAMLLASPFLATAAPAQYGGGYSVYTPGQPPTFVNPGPYGGYTVTSPGQSAPTFVNPNPYDGGYTITAPGQRPTFVNPNNPYSR